MSVEDRRWRCLVKSIESPSIQNVLIYVRNQVIVITSRFKIISVIQDPVHHVRKNVGSHYPVAMPVKRFVMKEHLVHLVTKPLKKSVKVVIPRLVSSVVIRTSPCFVQILAADC